MSFTRIKYDPCSNNNSCNFPTLPGEYRLDINRHENKNLCDVNKNTNISFYYNDIGNRIDIENELKALKHQLGDCSTNKPTLCLENPKQSICKVKPSVTRLCDRFIQCANENNNNTNNNNGMCFGLNARLN